jgi:hypothetical protein
VEGLIIPGQGRSGGRDGPGGAEEHECHPDIGKGGDVSEVFETGL